MRIRERLSRLARLSPATIPRVVVNRLAASARSAKERFFYRPEGPRRSAPARSIRRLGILHADARAAGFGGRFRQQFPEDAEQILAEADRATRLVVDVLGSGPVDLEAFRQRSDLRLYPGTTGAAPSEIALASRIPWHFDFKAGVAWPPATFFSDVAWGAAGVDIKVPWELSRCQHFVTLGQAYAITRDERFARAFSEQLEDWIRANPPKYGVNWACAMDVALRAANWLFAWD
ncbi:MAG: hypothetical protein JO102_01745, partial [Elusimicrobia bacterium]|nr:hypothetical protein [Elusimicrobiota bacterium]